MMASMAVGGAFGQNIAGSMNNMMSGINNPAQTEKPVCTAYPLCEGCPFPGHGFLCQGGDGECMRTRLMKLSDREEKSK